MTSEKTVVITGRFILVDDKLITFRLKINQ